MGNVNYKEDGFPLEVNLKAFSPLIPTDNENSGFPAVVLEYAIRNNGNEIVEAELIGWLQNTANLFTGNENILKKIITNNC